MGSSKQQLSSKHALPFKTANKIQRHDFHVKQKKARDNLTRDEKFRRKREEEKNPKLKEERLARNIPATIDRKRVWDNVDSDDDNVLNMAVDVERLKRQRLAEKEAQENGENEDAVESGSEDEDEDDVDSMLDSESEKEAESEDEAKPARQKRASVSPPRDRRASSPGGSTRSTNMNLTPDTLAEKFPTLFSPPREPKILITTSINSTLHKEAELLTELFPGSHYVRRTNHRYGHKFSIREISKFASNRDYTTVIVLNEDLKKPSGLDVVHLPHGPMFHFSISNWVEGKKLPGHGNATNHYPELILNNFRTPLGLLTAHLFRTMFPPQPEIEGRQVVTLHNQRDYMFFRRHRYVFRDKRTTEKSVVDADGKPMKGAEEIRAGLQELGPRFTLKLRRIDKGIQKASGQEWQWKAGSEKVRTRFQL